VLRPVASFSRVRSGKGLELPSFSPETGGDPAATGSVVPIGFRKGALPLLNPRCVHRSAKVAAGISPRLDLRQRTFDRE
jgi:hypothetical protein